MLAQILRLSEPIELLSIAVYKHRFDRIDHGFNSLLMGSAYRLNATDTLSILLQEHGL